MVRNIFVTGANRGIGLGLTKSFLNSGNKVIATYRDKAKSTELLQLEKTNPHLRALQLDVEAEQSMQRLVQYLNSVAHLDILVNNAGVMGDKSENLSGTTAKKILETISVNTIGPVRVTQALLPWLQKSKQPIVAQITSQMGSITDNKSGGYYGYRMSKAALNMFNKCLAQDYPEFICLALHPGWVQTDMGGAGASVTTTESAEGLANIILKSHPDQSGEFFTFRGEKLPW